MFFKSLHTITAHTHMSWFALQNQVQCSDSKSWGICCKISTCLTSTLTIPNFEHMLQVSPSLDKLVQVLAIPFSSWVACSSAAEGIDSKLGIEEGTELVGEGAVGWMTRIAGSWLAAAA